MWMWYFVLVNSKNMWYDKQKNLGCKKWCGQEKQQWLNGVIWECGQDYM